MNYRILAGAAALATAALGAPAQAGCCVAWLGANVRGNASVSGMNSGMDATHHVSAACQYSTTGAGSTSSTGEGRLTAVGTASSAVPQDMRVSVSCELVTPQGSYFAGDGDAVLGFVTVTTSGQTRVPGGLLVNALCVSATADWTNPGWDLGEVPRTCFKPGVTFRDAYVPIGV